MKTKKSFIGVSAAAVILVLLLISLRAYYVTVALIAGAFILGHRELWSLFRKRKLPPVDERVRGNVSQAVRNGFIFFLITTALLMTLFSINVTIEIEIVHLLSGLFLSSGLVYLLSYFYYDRAQPNMDQRGLKTLRVFLLTVGMALGTFIVSAVLHNAISALLGVEEPVFFILAVFVSPAALAVGLIGSLVLFLMGLFRTA